MEKPKCKICGERHYGMCAVPVPPTHQPHITPMERPIKKRNPNGTFDRTAYQRELMRKRRAAQKDQKN
jgi:hypothetical protein